MKSFLNYLDEVEDGKLIVALESARDNLKKALAHQQGQLNIRSNDIKSPQEILMVAKRKHQANKSWSLQKVAIESYLEDFDSQDVLLLKENIDTFECNNS
ncbi:hypothetical protein J7X25_004538 [Vibrio parahaemolyticus]|nr:hypothetical protein [Vibrio parahaemolyticus]EHH2561656.1 hypothetical protein [Vibrio parahaemolyticus]EKA7380079.1 hypothetical protein [Vibrio parahaemolyticus]